ncbi:dienelactone hydrolase family protein [Calothrix rhizosoleniae]|uniref:dienelactone hydrolase family protein n=2 Tax=Calothrix rhizosoleniae TaxID=888997 RepID=UPI000B49E04E
MKNTISCNRKAVFQFDKKLKQNKHHMEDFSTFYFSDNSSSKRLVYKKGSGPAVILMHELPGMIPECVDLARRLAENFTVYMPLLFGEPDKPLSALGMAKYTAQLCISKEFYCFAKNKSSPITDWLKALCRHGKQECGGQGVGVIGMCLTGGFALSLMADDSVIAPVASQPSLPFGITSTHKKALGISPDDLQNAKERANSGVPILALRFSEDSISPPEKFETLRQEFGKETDTIEDSAELCWKKGTVLETMVVNSKPNNPYSIPQDSHAVLTLGFSSNPEHPTNRVFKRVVEFLQEQFEK